MDTSTIPESIAQATVKSTKVRANDLLSLFNEYAPHIKVLSLDCFDTLLWRNVVEPTDVFYDLAQRPECKKAGLSQLMRMEAEKLCSHLNLMRYGSAQVTLKEIYRQIFPNAEEEKINLFVEGELAAEIDACYAFSPIVELIRLAHSKKIKIIIVSDTYLEESHLRRLLSSKLPADVMSSISEIFCSCEHQQSKSNGLFIPVLKKMNVSPQSILHIGDNPIADFEAAKQAEINAVHLVHHEERIEELLRMKAISASLFDTSIRASRSSPSPFCALFATQLPQVEAENMIGYASAGPILYAFALFIQDEVEKLKASGKNPKVLFLMRDGYLPSLVCDAIAGKPVGTQVRISRFVSYAASFRTKGDIENYLISNVQSKRFDDLCRQLLLPDQISAYILKKVVGSNNSIQEFCQLILHTETMNTIFSASTAYRKRLIRYLENEVDLQSGDCLLLVDLGYTGTTQNKLAPIFKEELNVDMLGCYLISLCTHDNAEFQDSRVGLFNPAVYDESALVMLVTFIAIFEQVCTCNEASITDYDTEGQPIYSDVMVGENQQKKLDLIQSECLRFARDASDFSQSLNTSITPTMLRDTAAANLCRFIFFLTQTEREFLQTFKFELNLGTKDLLSLIDVDKGLASLRRKGWLHSLKDNTNTKRMNYPAEWRAINYNLTLGLIAEHRFGLKIAVSDLSQQREKLEVMIADDQQCTKMHFEAMPTHDGFFSILIPVVNDQCEVGICFGLNYRWVELECAELIRFDRLNKKNELEFTEDASPNLAVKHLADRGAGLFECESNSSLLIFVPDSSKAKFKENIHILRVVFRPVGLRK